MKSPEEIATSVMEEYYPGKWPNNMMPCRLHKLIAQAIRDRTEECAKLCDELQDSAENWALLAKTLHEETKKNAAASAYEGAAASIRMMNSYQLDT